MKKVLKNMQKTTCELKNMRHSRIFRMKSRLFGFQMKISFECLIHGREFVCFLESAHIYCWVWGKFLKVTKNFVYPGQQRRFLRIFWLQWLAASVCCRHRSTPPHARKGKNVRGEVSDSRHLRWLVATNHGAPPMGISLTTGNRNVHLPKQKIHISI